MLLEREGTLAALDGLLANAGAGRGAMVWLVGEAGVGKTAVCRQFLESQERAVARLVGTCDPLGTRQPLGPLHDMAEAAGGRLQRALLEETPRDRIFTLFLEQLRRRPGPSIVLIEDVHWADEATLDLIRYAARRLDSTSSLLIVTYREEELDAAHPLRIVIGDLATTPWVHRFELERLTPAAVRRMARGRDLDPDRLYETTAGNPFFVSELLRSTDGRMPASVRASVLARAARLSPPALKALRVVAALGVEVNDTLALDLAATTPAAIQECVNTGLLEWEPGRLRFRHELSRAAVADSTPPAERRVINQDILTALRMPSGGLADAAQLAYHADQAGDGAAALEYAVAAAQQARRLGAHREAAVEYGRALRWAAGLAADERLVLLQAHSSESYITGAIADAVRSAQEALAICAASGSEQAEANAMAWLATLVWNTDRRVEAIPLARSAVSILERLGQGPEQAKACVVVGNLHAKAAEMGEAGHWARRALSLAVENAFPEVEIQALLVLASAKLCSPSGDGWPELGRALELAQNMRDHAQVADVYGQINWFGAMHRQFQWTRRRFAQSVRFCEEHDLLLNRMRLLESRCVELMHRGAWTDAADLAASLLRRPGLAPVDRIQPLYVLGRIRARRGDPDIWAPLDEALEIAAPRDELQHIGNVRAARAEAAWLEGDAGRAAREAAGAYKLSLLSKDPWIVGELALWLWRGGALPELPECAHEHPYGLQIRGLTRAAAGAWLRLGCPFEASCALLDSGSEVELRRALRRFETLGAAPAAAMAARRLRALGVRGLRRGPTRATRANPFELTHRELEVLELIRLGMTDGEIGLRLSIATRTVNHHVSSLLGKLGARSRLDATRRLPSLR